MNFPQKNTTPSGGCYDYEQQSGRPRPIQQRQDNPEIADRGTPMTPYPNPSCPSLLIDSFHLLLHSQNNPRAPSAAARGVADFPLYNPYPELLQVGSDQFVRPAKQQEQGPRLDQANFPLGRSAIPAPSFPQAPIMHQNLPASHNYQPRQRPNPLHNQAASCPITHNAPGGLYGPYYQSQPSITPQRNRPIGNIRLPRPNYGPPVNPAFPSYHLRAQYQHTSAFSVNRGMLPQQYANYQMATAGYSHPSNSNNGYNQNHVGNNQWRPPYPHVASGRTGSRIRMGPEYPYQFPSSQPGFGRERWSEQPQASAAQYCHGQVQPNLLKISPWQGNANIGKRFIPPRLMGPTPPPIRWTAIPDDPLPVGQADLDLKLKQIENDALDAIFDSWTEFEALIREEEEARNLPRNSSTPQGQFSNSIGEKEGGCGGSCSQGHTPLAAAQVVGASSNRVSPTANRKHVLSSTASRNGEILSKALRVLETPPLDQVLATFSKSWTASDIQSGSREVGKAPMGGGMGVRAARPKVVEPNLSSEGIPPLSPHVLQPSASNGGIPGTPAPIIPSAPPGKAGAAIDGPTSPMKLGKKAKKVETSLQKLSGQPGKPGKPKAPTKSGSKKGKAEKISNHVPGSPPPNDQLEKKSLSSPSSKEVALPNPPSRNTEGQGDDKLGGGNAVVDRSKREEEFIVDPIPAVYTEPVLTGGKPLLYIPSFESITPRIDPSRDSDDSPNLVICESITGSEAEADEGDQSDRHPSYREREFGKWEEEDFQNPEFPELENGG